MEVDFPNSGLSFEQFLNEVTANVMRCALDQVVASCTEDLETEDEDALVEHLSQDIDQDSLLNSVTTGHANLAAMKLDLEEMHHDAIYAKCCEITKDIISDVCTEVNRILQSSDNEMADDIEASRRKGQLIHCIKNSNRIQNFFQDISVSIIQSALEEMRINDDHCHKTESLANTESDIGHSINKTTGNSRNVIFQNGHQKMASSPTWQDSDAPFVGPVPQHNSSSKDDELVEQESTMDELSFYSVPDESSLSNIKSTNSSATGFMTADSAMYITADEGTQQSYDEESSQERFISFQNESSTGLKMEIHDVRESVATRMPDKDLDQSLSDQTLCETIVGPRQSTPLSQGNDIDILGDPHIVSTTENLNILPDDFQVISDNESEVLNKSEQELQVLTDDESSIGDHSSPRTLSRQSSAFGNVTLEFDTEWEPGMKGFQQENVLNKEEKHQIILHELSFDERADLKAPDLLGPVFLAVLDDDESEDSFKKRQKLSQSIDDLCEMISEDENEDLPLRRRAMSLEVTKPATSKGQRKKVPTKEELMKAFQDLRNEIMDDEDFDQLVEDDEAEEKDEEEENDKWEENDEGEDKEGEEKEEWEEEDEEEEKEVEEKGEWEEEDEVEEKGEWEEEDEGEVEKVDQKGEENEGKEKEEERMEVEEKKNETRLKKLEERNDELENGLQDPTRWHTVVFNGQHKVIDLKLLEPFLKVLTHGGYHHEGGKKTVIVVLTACNLPNKRMKRYPLLMEQLFFFIISTMDLLVTSDEYIFVYFHGGTSKNQSPSLSWIKKYYQYISRRLKKSLTKVYVVHPNFWLKSVFQLCRPFVSSNFSRKLKFVSTLKELSTYVKTDFIFVPDEVIRVDPDYKNLHSS